jgi:hypothetical protein
MFLDDKQKLGKSSAIKTQKIVSVGTGIYFIR